MVHRESHTYAGAMDWGRRVVIVAPHPDDEVIGAGGHLADLPDVWVVQVTDGAPRKMADAHRWGFESREDYARQRHIEATHALRLAGIGPERILPLGFVDQETAMHLPELSARVSAVVRALRSDTVLTPAYEGGHPDHDSVAFAIHQACRKAPVPPRLVEYTLYHAGPHGIATGEFLENGFGPAETVALSATAMSRKQQMLACFVTQQETLAQFSVREECFREAPRYDFESPPHAGPLFYERFSWGVTGAEWRALAREASSCFAGT